MQDNGGSNERTGVAGESLLTKKYYIVQLDASGNIEVAEGATDLIVGVLQNKPDTGEAAVVRFGGTSKVVCGGTVNIGDWLTSDGSGKAIATTTDGNITIGRALYAGGDGDVVEVQMSIQHLYIA